MISFGLELFRFSPIFRFCVNYIAGDELNTNSEVLKDLQEVLLEVESVEVESVEVESVEVESVEVKSVEVESVEVESVEVKSVISVKSVEVEPVEVEPAFSNVDSPHSPLHLFTPFDDAPFQGMLIYLLLFPM